jgi:hypothetical protein
MMIKLDTEWDTLLSSIRKNVLTTNGHSSMPYTIHHVYVYKIGCVHTSAISSGHNNIYLRKNAPILLGAESSCIGSRDAIFGSLAVRKYI